MLLPLSAGSVQELTSYRAAHNYAMSGSAMVAGAPAAGDDTMTENSEIQVSERAARRIGQILRGETEGAMLRVSVEGGGCSGFQYKFDIERERAEDDIVIARGDAVVLVDPVSSQFMSGSEIDFVDDLIGASFRINNPNATASCGCGTSFSV
jgi:iron-sulfur cluster assembly accessory protein